jgi:hypothetical protein
MTDASARYAHFHVVIGNCLPCCDGGRTSRRCFLISERMIRFRMATFGVIPLSVLASLGAHGADSGDPPVLTVCQALRDPARYGGQTVIIVGRSVGTSEGSWLDEDCGLDLTIEGRKYRTTISTSYSVSEFAPPPMKPKGFNWNMPLLKEALAEVKKTTRLESGAKWYAVYGRLETGATQSVVLSDGRTANTIGYGHLNAAPAQIVANTDCWLKLR